ncbi:uncharacterized protein LOC128198809 [Bicyclus anynana]|uniref:Uncharacterized protein LOC128198809 n=1 Tax=Bicyclus anynana TaxID=110368 RepID=A0ABM3LS14_BICAN|nr:uncharacterized protein LOC128198809 [Bicyclus anynana]
MSLLLQKKYLLLLEEELQSEEAELIALYYLNKRKHRFWKRSHLYYHTSHGEFFTLFNELDDESFTKSYRLPRNIFYELHNLIKPHIFKQDTNYRRSICTQERLAVCLKYLATGSKFSQIAENFRIGKSTVPRIIEDVCDALWTVLQPLVMPELNENDWKKISKQFEEIWQFKNCVGAIDGKHVYMFAPPKSGSLYYCYKHRFSTVMMCVADATRRIIMVDIGSMGRFSDGGIFADSIFGIRLRENRLNLPQPQPLYQNGEPVPFVFIGDEAFPLMTNLMRPYPRDNLNNEKRTYNYRLSRARRIVEATFGVLSRKWYVYRKEFECKIETVEKVIKATCVLHNFLIDKMPGYLDNNETGLATTMFNDTNVENLLSNDNMDAYQVREKFCSYFNNEGAVPWQDTRITILLERNT